MRVDERCTLCGVAALAAFFASSAFGQTSSPNNGLPLPGPESPIVVHNADGSTTSISQSGRGTRTNTVDQNGAQISTVDKVSNFDGGRWITVGAGTVTTKTEYDSHGNVVRLERIDSGTGTRNLFEYDDNGQLLKASTFHRNADGKEEPQDIYDPRDTPSGKPERYNPETGKFERISKSDQDDIEFNLKKTADEIKGFQDKYALSDEEEMAAIRAEAAKEPMAGPDGQKTPTPTPTLSESIDPCLVGTWECVSYQEKDGKITGGGTGFRVTFTSDGTETVDYGSIKPIMVGKDKLSYMGKASAKISTTDGVAKIESMTGAGASLDTIVLGRVWQPRIPGLGAGGLGSTTDKNRYQCNGDTLEYQTSAARDGHATSTVKLQRVDEMDLLAEGTGSAPSKPKRTPTPVVRPKPVSPKPVSPPPVSPRPGTPPPVSPEAESPTASPKPKPPPAAAGGKPQPSATLRAGPPSIAPTILPSPRPSAPTSPSPSRTPIYKEPPSPSSTVKPAASATVSATPTTSRSFQPQHQSPTLTPTASPSRTPIRTVSATISPTPARLATPSPSTSRTPSPANLSMPSATPTPSPSGQGATGASGANEPAGASSSNAGPSPGSTMSAKSTYPIPVALPEYGGEVVAHDPTLPLLINAGPTRYSATYHVRLTNGGSASSSPVATEDAARSASGQQTFPISFSSSTGDSFTVVLSFEARDEQGNVEAVNIRPLRSAQELEPSLALEHAAPDLFRFGIDPAELSKLKPGKHSIRPVFSPAKSGEAVSSSPTGAVKPLTIELKPTGLTSEERKIDIQQAARFYLRDRDYAKAEKLVEAARNLDGLSVGAWEMRGETFLAQNKLPQAEEAFKTALANSRMVKHPGLSAPREEGPEQISKYLEKVQALKKQKK